MEANHSQYVLNFKSRKILCMEMYTFEFVTLKYYLKTSPVLICFEIDSEIKYGV